MSYLHILALAQSAFVIGFVCLPFLVGAYLLEGKGIRFIELLVGKAERGCATEADFREQSAIVSPADVAPWRFPRLKVVSLALGRCRQVLASLIAGSSTYCIRLREGITGK